MWQAEGENLRTELEGLQAQVAEGGSNEEKLTEFKNKWGAEVMERKKLANDVEVTGYRQYDDNPPSTPFPLPHPPLLPSATLIYFKPSSSLGYVTICPNSPPHNPFVLLKHTGENEATFERQRHDRALAARENPL